MHKLYVPVDDETWDILNEVADLEDREIKAQAARWLKQRSRAYRDDPTDPDKF